jgi:GTP-binding protein
MHHNFHEYAPQRGDVPGRSNGVMVSMVGGSVNAFALNNLQERGAMFVEPGDPVYEGQVVAENARDNDMAVNPTTTKKLSNMRTTSSDENIILKPARKMTLEQALEYIEEDELVEATPSSIRLRKELLTENQRKKAGRKKVVEVVEA